MPDHGCATDIRESKIAFLSLGEPHHDIALVQRATGPQRKVLDMETGEAVGETLEVLKAKV